jgi:uroporphyrinogen decarboxylase
LPDGSDCLIPAWVDVRKVGDDWIIHSSTGRPVGIQKAGSLYFEQTHWPFIDGVPDDLSQLSQALGEVSWSARTPPGPDADLAAGAKALRASTDRAIIGLFGGNLLEIGQMLFRNDNFFMLLAGEPERAHRFLDKLMEIHLRNLDGFLDAVAEHIDVILFGDDLGMQSGPQVSPAMYREYFKPRERAMWQRVKARAPHLKIQLHCCGGVRELLPDLIDAGLDAINPVQITCRGIDAAGLKRDSGRRLTFWGGGCDTRDILIKGTPAQVREHVRQQVNIWKPGGGFVFQQVHNIMGDVPSANVVAMYDAALSA